MSLHIEVIGAGMVGSAIGAAMDEWGNDVVFKDIDEDTRQSLEEQGYRTGRPDSFNGDTDLSIICVPTPFDYDEGQYDHSIVRSEVKRIAERDYSADHTTMIHSTVMPTVTNKFIEEYDMTNVAMVPEVLRENSAMNDVFETEKIIIGTDSRRAYSVIRSAYPDNKEFKHVTTTEAELIKLTSNNFGSTKISFANEVWRFAEQLGADGDVVLDQFRDICPWIGYPALKGGWPYGGACLPKDSRGTAAWADEHDVDLPQLHATIEENEIMQDLDDKKDPQV